VLPKHLYVLAKHLRNFEIFVGLDLNLKYRNWYNINILKFNISWHPQKTSSSSYNTKCRPTAALINKTYSCGEKIS